MARVRRQNVVLTIKDDEVQHYLNLGYKVIDDNNNVIAGEEPDYKQLYFQEKEKNVALEAKLQEYEAIRKLGDKAPSKEPVEEPKPEEEPKPRRRRSSKAKEDAQTE